MGKDAAQVFLSNLVMKLPVVHICNVSFVFIVLSSHNFIFLDALHILFLNSKHFYTSNFYYTVYSFFLSSSDA